MRKKIDLDVLDARGLTKHGSDQFAPSDGEACFADRPAHEIAALKRARAMPRAIQLYDPALIEAVAKLYAEDIRLYTQTTGRTCVFPS